MLKLFTFVFVLAFLIAPVNGQGVNSAFSALGINQPATDPSIQGSGPFTSQVFTDSLVTANIRGFPNNPIVLFQGSLQIGSYTGYGLSIDIQPIAGFAANILLDGYAAPSSATWTNGSGDLSVSASIPACSTNAQNIVVCNLPSSFSVTLQAVTFDPTGPFYLGTSAAVTALFANGYQQFSLSQDNYGIFNFLGGFSFNYYGNNYTRAWLSANGYVSFTPASTGFPSPSVACVRGGPPRILSFYNDLEPQITVYNPRIYAQQFEEGGARKIKFVHARLAEFGNATGPHGGEIVIEESGPIHVLVGSYNAWPSIHTVVGISPGGNQDTTSPTAYGHDLSSYFTQAALQGFPVGSSGSPMWNSGEALFELFDHGVTPPASPNNPLDLAGLGGTGGGYGIGFYPVPGGFGNTWYEVGP